MTALIKDNYLSFRDVLYVDLAIMLKELAYMHLRIKEYISRIIHHIISQAKGTKQSELPRPIPQLSVKSDLRCTSGIYFDNACDYVMLTSQKPC